MAVETIVRESTPNDLPQIERLYPLAFPDEDLVSLVGTLLQDGPPVLSLVASTNTHLIAHIVFTICGVVGHDDKCALLGPLGVVPEAQRQGIGKMLIRKGLKQLEARDFKRIFVLGDPSYYGRFGFATESDIPPPYALPEEWAAAWQSIDLGEEKIAYKGVLSLPSQWLQPALWQP